MREVGLREELADSEELLKGWKAMKSCENEEFHECYCYIVLICANAPGPVSLCCTV